MSAAPASASPRPVMTVKASMSFEQLGITDAHNHVWIDAIPGVRDGSPVLNQYDLILKELVEYRENGGGTLLDCQPGGCGRDGSKLLQLSKASGVNLVACTGFHRPLYYPTGYWLWSASAEQVGDAIVSELEHGLSETVNSPAAVKAGFIKVALEETWADCPLTALEGAAAAAARTRALLEIHTEKGSLAEKACIYFMDRKVLPQQLVLCHMDKRPVFSLHKALAELGVLLEYDTFYRPKYNPEANLWPLADRMVGEGLSNRIALATDMADAALYHHIGGGPGLSSLPGEIQYRLTAGGYPEIARQQMLGENIARRLAGII